MLVLDIVFGMNQFADIVIEGSCPHQQRIGADGFGGFGRQIRNLHRVLERAGGFFGKAVQQLGVDVGQFDQRHRTQQPERFLKQEDQTVGGDDQGRVD